MNKDKQLFGWCITILKKFFDNSDPRKFFYIYDNMRDQGKGGKSRLADFIMYNFSKCIKIGAWDKRKDVWCAYRDARIGIIDATSD